MFVNPTEDLRNEFLLCHDSDEFEATDFGFQSVSEDQIIVYYFVNKLLKTKLIPILNQIITDEFKNSYKHIYAVLYVNGKKNLTLKYNGNVYVESNINNITKELESIIDNVWSATSVATTDRMLFIKIIWSIISFDSDFRSFLDADISKLTSDDCCKFYIPVFKAKMISNFAKTDEDIKIYEQIFSKFNKSSEQFEYHSIARSIFKIYKLYSDVDIDKVIHDLYTKRAKVSKDIEGQVFTPDHIKNLCVSKSMLANGYNIYDPTCGTGGFLDQACRYAKSHNIHLNEIHGTEKDSNLSIVAWLSANTNRDLKYIIHNDTCFNLNLDIAPIDVIFMNPPYGMKGKEFSEMNFVLYNIEHHLKDNGMIFAVIPTSCVSENKANTENKQKLIDLCQIEEVIKLRDDLFYPQASKSACILVARKLSNHERSESILLNYSNDGGYKKRGSNGILFDMKIFNDTLDKINNYDDSICYSELLTPNSDWNYKESISFSFDKRAYYLRKADERCANEKSKLMKTVFENEPINLKEVKISDIFCLEEKSINYKFKSEENELDSGIYPLISARKINNGIMRYVDNYEYDGDYITVASQGDGGAGYCFVQHDKFACGACIHVLKCINAEFIDRLDELAFIMTTTFSNEYSHAKSLSKTRLMNETLFIPSDFDDLHLTQSPISNI